MGVGFYGHIGAIEFIPVGLTAILFFTFPPVIAVIQAVLNRELPGMGKFAGAGGLLLWARGDARRVLRSGGPPGHHALALGASLCVAWNTVWTARKLSHCGWRGGGLSHGGGGSGSC